VIAKENLTVGEATAMLNKHSGLVGISGISSDMREIEREAERGQDRARLAVDVLAYRVKKYIGAYAAAMGGIDAVTFTGGIGSNSSELRTRSLEGLGFLGIELDRKKNVEAIGCDMEISSEVSRVRIFSIMTNEELVIALDTERIVSSVEQHRR
jgi:acetate kinase